MGGCQAQQAAEEREALERSPSVVSSSLTSSQKSDGKVSIQPAEDEDDNPYIRRAHRISRISHCNAVYPPQAHTVTFQQSFFLRTAQDWNDLPTEVATIIDTQAFKRLIETILS
ncbi:uncharacterized protein LOC119186647 isoform X4 [Rhipicephalus microplus]|uniref:uncharacterized protein LOC119186647 isoform X4 n=1 Tax=Rhipicephalus microplus TaxID=6941 RepID=UPI003F6AC03E